MTKLQIMIGTVALWGAACLVHFSVQTTVFLNGPHIGDLYAYSWGFQALSFAVFPFPVWALALVITLFAEWRYLRKKEGMKIPNTSIHKSGCARM